jgi:uncharacterized membrane protein
MSMAHQDVFSAQDAAPALPTVRTIGPADLKRALLKGIDDFAAMPSHAVFLCLIYPIVGLLLARAAFGYDLVPLLFPLAAGFALLGPIAALGLYELSRRREAGQRAGWEDMAELQHSPSLRAIAALATLLLVIFCVWIWAADAIYVASFGYRGPQSISGFLHRVFTTPEGHWLILVGNGVGFLFALGVLIISAVSFPLLLDRNIGALAAVATSVRVVLKNPLTMALWGLTVAVALALGSLPLFFGLAVVVPVLGHASWHLYRAAVEPAPAPPQTEHHAPPPGRHAADFPAVLFPWAREH